VFTVLLPVTLKLLFGALRINAVMIMYHGTSESSARAIESGGFCVSEDGMLGKGVYCSRHR